MSRAQDIARVAKGLGLVAQELLEKEGPVVAERCLKLRQHGVGLSTSIKDVSEALFVRALSVQSSVVLACSVSEGKAVQHSV